MITRAVRLRCPVCGTKWLLVHWLKPRPACANCGQALERAEEGEGHYLGAMVVTFAVTESQLALLVLLVIVLSWPTPPWSVLMYGGLALAVTTPLAFYPIGKLLWLAVDLYVQPEL